MPKEHENVDSFGEGKVGKTARRTAEKWNHCNHQRDLLCHTGRLHHHHACLPGQSRERNPSSFSFCLCILHTRCSEPIKADGVCWKQYTARGERGRECGIRLCWELKVHEACIITYIRQIYIPSTCLLIVVSHRNGHFQNVKDLLETIWLKIQTP